MMRKQVYWAAVAGLISFPAHAQCNLGEIERMAFELFPSASEGPQMQEFIVVQVEQQCPPECSNKSASADG
jgi:hypothetical protein